MCGIVAVVARKDIVDVLIEGLNKLEDRGYDSAGLAVSSGHGMRRLRAADRIAELERRAKGLRPPAGTAHTHLATHVVPLQLFSKHGALFKVKGVDKQRNLAKLVALKASQNNLLY